MVYKGKWKENSRKIARRIMANRLACVKLPSWLYVHHRDGNPFNNSIDNLELVDHKQHSKIHLLGVGKLGIPFQGNTKEYRRIYDAMRQQDPNRKADCKRNSIAFRQRRREQRLLQLKGGIKWEFSKQTPKPKFQ